jgi:DNA polymerase elongation subunit (family B)
MLFDVTYYKPQRDIPEHFAVLHRDLKTKEKHLELIYDPKVPIYFTKKEHRDHTYHKYLEELNKLDMVMVRPSDILRTIAEDSPSGKRFYNDCMNRRDFRKMQELQAYPYVYASDFSPEVYYRYWWLENCKTELFPMVTRGFSDIEVDITNDNGSFTETGNCPVNAVTVINDETKECHTMLLIPKDGDGWKHEQYLGYQALLADMEGFQKELTTEFNVYGKLSYSFHWYDDDVSLLLDYFKYVHSTRLDFLVYWNMSFDIPYMIKRLEFMGINPADIICDPAFPIKECRFKVDTIHFEITQRDNFFYCSSYTKFMDQMDLYAKHRKADHKRSYALDAVAEAELGNRKLQYKTEGMELSEFMYRDYRNFVKYNIKDVMLQYGIDNVTEDLMYTWIVTDMMLCNYDQIFKPTVNIPSRVYMEFQQE